MVTELSNDKENDNNEQETSETKSEEFALKTEVLAFASRSKAKAKPRRSTSTCSSSKTVPFRERIWIDIEPGAQSDQASLVAKRIKHDGGMLKVMSTLLGGIPGGDQEKEDARRLATLARMVPAAYWASWADALPMVHELLPGVAQNAVTAFEGDGELEGCLGELRVAAVGLDRQGFLSRPQWRALQKGARPPPLHDTGPGKWAHGWQYHAASASEYHFRKSVVFAQSCPAHQAHLRSHSGSGCSHLLHGCPTRPEFKIDPLLFRVLVLERLRVPLLVTEARCECGAALDFKGRHRAACPHSGRLRTRALSPERTFARVCREACFGPLQCQTG